MIKFKHLLFIGSFLISSQAHAASSVSSTGISLSTLTFSSASQAASTSYSYLFKLNIAAYLARLTDRNCSQGVDYYYSSAKDTCVKRGLVGAQNFAVLQTSSSTEKEFVCKEGTAMHLCHSMNYIQQTDDIFDSGSASYVETPESSSTIDWNNTAVLMTLKSSAY